MLFYKLSMSIHHAYWKASREVQRGVGEMGAEPQTYLGPPRRRCQWGQEGGHELRQWAKWWARSRLSQCWMPGWMRGWNSCWERGGDPLPTLPGGSVQRHNKMSQRPAQGQQCDSSTVTENDRIETDGLAHFYPQNKIKKVDYFSRDSREALNIWLVTITMTAESRAVDHPGTGTNVSRECPI